MNKFIIEQANHTLGTFFRVLNNGVIVMQAETKAACLEWIESNAPKAQPIELSKATVNALNKLNVGVTIFMLDDEDYYSNEHDAEMIIHLDKYGNYEGDAIYKLYATENGFKAVLWAIWNKDATNVLPEVINGEKELKTACKAMSKGAI